MVLERGRLGLSTAAGPVASRIISRPLALLILVAAAWLLVAPRVPIFGVGGSSVRAEDFLLVILGIIVFVHWTKLASGFARSGIALLVTVNCLAAVVAVLSARVDLLPAVLYSMRILEYWVVLPALGLAFHCLSADMVPKLLGFVTIAQVATSALQTYAGFSIGFSKFSYDRGSGLTAGPYELGAMCAMLAVYWLSRRNWFFTCASIAGVFISASRISIPALLVGIACMLIIRRLSGRNVDGSKTRLGPRNVILSSVLFAVAALVYTCSPVDSAKLGEPTLERLQGTSTIESWHKSGDMAASYKSPETVDEYTFLAYESVRYSLSQGQSGFGSTGDDSTLVRFFRWHVLIDAIDDPSEILLGLGPSFAGPSVDGSYMRIFAETGFAGLLAWGYAFRRWFKGASPWLVGVLATVCVGAVFIDVLVALRPMVLMWVLVAVARYEMLINGK